jgi:DNA-3-methyladenine glycosylase
MGMLLTSFFDRDAAAVARDLVGTVLRRRVSGRWLSAAIVETEAYYRSEKGSHASLGRTPSREALFMPAGTLYMYYSRGGDSLNVGTRGSGDAVLFKSARPHGDEATIEAMHGLNPGRSGRRPDHRLLAGQTLLAKALSLRVPDWTCRPFDPDAFYVDDLGARPRIVRCRRLGIPEGRDEDLMLRFVDAAHVRSATQNPLTKRAWTEGPDYQFLDVRGGLEPS